jgi:hypothetical protein
VLLLQLLLLLSICFVFSLCRGHADLLRVSRAHSSMRASARYRLHMDVALRIAAHALETLIVSSSLLCPPAMHG